jgi:tetratricopeptide (TPR) repeat protein
MTKLTQLAKPSPDRTMRDVDSLFRAAAEHQRHDRLQDALTLYDSIIRAEPKMAAAHYNRGVVLHSLGKAEDALRSYDIAIHLRPDLLGAHYNRAIALKTLGRLEDAIRSYDDLIARDPDNPHAYNNRSSIMRELGRIEEALRSATMAVALKPDFAEAHNNLGRAFQDLRRLSEALESFNKATALKPGYAEAYNNLGNALRALGRSAEALQSYDKALAISTDYPEVHYNRAIALKEVEGLEAAIKSFDGAIKLNPRFAAAHNDKGLALRDLGRLEESLSCFSRAVELMPHHGDAHKNRGSVLLALKRPHEALNSFDLAVALAPDCAEAHNDRGNALLELGHPNEALGCYEKAIQLDPQLAEAHCNKAFRLRELKRVDEAIRCYDAAIRINPGMAGAYWDKSLCLLMKGDWEAGWPLHEWRKKKPKPSGLWKSPDQEWTGKESLEGKTLFIHAEQGLGDTIQFCRYARLARAKAAKVILGVPDALVRLLKGLGGEIDVVASIAPPDAFDIHIPLMSMPLAFRTTPDDCLSEVPYLKAEPGTVAKWKARLGRDGFKVGICWQGSMIDAARAFPVAHLESVARIPDVRLISLQKHDGVEQLRELPIGMKVETLGDDFDAGTDAFVDAAAVVECLDLVIASDTAIAHLAGALARPTWVVLKYVPDWRWLLDRPDSPWYPTMRLFRQPGPGDWSGVFADIRANLAKLIGRDGEP